jgi:Pyruvate/2-oxoacid:ferredoxin oxidoreductase delta subunit
MAKIKIESVDQLPIMPLTIEDMTWNRTGSWRLLTPVVGDKIPPCQGSCPIGQPIPEFIQAALEGDWDLALSQLMEHNPLPGVTGRLCYHPCQAKCLRRKMDRAVEIKALENAAAERGRLPRPVKKPATGRRVAVLGAGLAGLTAAYHLALRGCQVLVLDPAERPGGFLNDIASDKLPPEVLDREVQRLISVAGLDIKTCMQDLEGGPYELVLIDRTAHPAGSLEETVLKKMAAQVLDGLEITWESSSASFKASQVSRAVGLGLQAALQAERRLGGDELVQAEAAQPERVLVPAAVKFERLPDEKTMRLEAAAAGEPDASLRAEAGRCLSCGTCNLCQSCVLGCPDACCLLDEEKQRIIIDLYHCKGCGICSYECPRGVLALENV